MRGFLHIVILADYFLLPFLQLRMRTAHSKISNCVLFTAYRGLHYGRELQKSKSSLIIMKCAEITRLVLAGCNFLLLYLSKCLCCLIRYKNWRNETQKFVWTKTIQSVLTEFTCKSAKLTCDLKKYSFSF